MPTRARSSFTSMDGESTFCPSSRISPVGALLGIEAVDPVEGAQQRRLPAAGGADEGGHLTVVEIERDVLQAAEIAVVEIEVPDGDAHRRAGIRSGRVSDGAAG